jgi:hypothetical protein
MSVKADELEQYNDQRVIIVKNLKEPNDKGEESVEVEGTVVTTNAFGVMIKPKGKVNADIIELADIEEIRFAPQKVTPIKQKVLQLITFGNARKHLASAHGVELEWLNANSEEVALKWHSELDHTKLGHRHEAKSETEKAVEDAKSEDDAA